MWFQSSLWSLSYLQAFPCCWHGRHNCQTCLHALISALYLPSLHPCLWSSFWHTENRQWNSGWQHLCCSVLQASVPEWFKCSHFLRSPNIDRFAASCRSQFGDTGLKYKVVSSLGYNPSITTDGCLIVWKNPCGHRCELIQEKTTL